MNQNWKTFENLSLSLISVCKLKLKALVYLNDLLTDCLSVNLLYSSRKICTYKVSEIYHVVIIRDKITHL